MASRGQPMADKSSYLAHAWTIITLGVFYMASPNDWYGPSWSYFAHHGQFVIPAGGFGLGVCLAGIGAAQLLLVWRNIERFLPLTFFLSGFVFWAAGFLLGAEGLLGHRGLQEAPLFITIGAFKFIVMSVLIANRRETKLRDHEHH